MTMMKWRTTLSRLRRPRSCCGCCLGARCLTPHSPLSATPITRWGSTSARDPLPRVVDQEAIFENPWLRLKRIRYLDRRGRERSWTGLERTTTHPTLERALPPCRDPSEPCDAVVIVPMAIAARELVVIRQFRPAVGRWVLELPAGLIDDGESPEAAAARELVEETGCTTARVLQVGPPMVNDQGLTNGRCRLVFVAVDEDPARAATTTQRLEDDEMIDVLRAPLDGLVPWLDARRADHGDVLDARLYSFALGREGFPTDK